MRKYYLICKFNKGLYSKNTNSIIKLHTIVGDTGTILQEMYKYTNEYAKSEDLIFDGKKKGTIFRDNVKVGTFAIETRMI